MYSIFTGDIVDCVKEGKRRLILVGKRTTPELLFPDELAVGSFTVNGLQKGLGKITKLQETELNFFFKF